MCTRIVARPHAAELRCEVGQQDVDRPLARLQHLLLRQPVADVTNYESDVFLRQRLDGLKVDSNDFTGRTDDICGNLQPSSRPSPEIQYTIAAPD